MGGLLPQNSFLGIDYLLHEWLSSVHSDGLKEDFGALRRPMDIKLSNLSLVIYSCFVLHNFCETEKEPISESRFKHAIDYDKQTQPPMKVNKENYNNSAELIRKISTKFFE